MTVQSILCRLQFNTPLIIKKAINGETLFDGVFTREVFAEKISDELRGTDVFEVYIKDYALVIEVSI